MLNLGILEKELKKRWRYPYHWGRKQSDEWDRKTNFIYKTQNFDELLNKIYPFGRDLRDYAMNRWYNFWSAMGIEEMFAAHKNVIANKNSYDKLIDFRINNIPFDHKTSVYPGGFGFDVDYALKNKKVLIEWLYQNQSQQGRKHLKNRLFIILYNGYGQHWKMKAELTSIEKIIDIYVKSFNINNLISLNYGQGRIFSDIIWFLKR